MNEEILHIGKEWISHLPKGWKADRIKDVCENLVSGGTPKSSIIEFWEDGDVIWLSPTDFSKQKGKKFLTDSEKKITQLGLKSSSATLIPIGTVIMSSRASIGEAKIAGCELSTNQGFISFIPNFRMHNNFLFYAIEGHLGSYFNSISSGTTFNEISRRMVKQENIPVPDIEVQKAIADYLDLACNRIDKIIEIKKEQLKDIEKYYDSKVHELITKGLDKDETLIDSGIDWQGNVPKSWKREKLYRLSNKMGSGGTPKSTNPEYYFGDIPWIQSGDLNDGIVSKTKKKINDRAIKESSAKMFEKGTLLIAMYGATIGKLGMMDMDAATNQACCAIQVGPKLNSEFIFYLLYDMRKYLIAQSYGGGQPNISQEVLKQQYFYFPKKEKQIVIVENIKVLKDQVDKLKKKVKKQIETLTDYRKSLIHECLTGKKQISEIVLEQKKAKA